jgi:hypothetical protein
VYVECLACLDYLESHLLLISHEDTQGDQDEQHTQGVQDDQGTQGNQWGLVLAQGKQGKHLKCTGLAHLE